MFNTLNFRLTIGLLMLAVFLGISGCPAPINPAEYVTVTVQITGQGIVAPSGGSWPKGSPITFRATPQAGWQFDRWEGDLTGSDNPRAVTLTSNLNVTAVFVSSNVNRSPEAYDLAVTTNTNTPVNITLLATDKDADPLTYSIVDSPTNGNLFGSSPAVTYTPTPGYAGPDLFTYQANDGQNDSNLAKVNITVITPNTIGWAKTFGSGQSDIVHDVAVGPNGNVYAAGEFRGTVDFDPGLETKLHASGGESDVFLIKFSTQGTFQWVRTIGGSGSDVAYGVVVDATGNVYLAGTFTGTMTVDADTGTLESSNGGNDGFICKFSSAGTFSWSRSFGGPADDLAYAVGVDHVGNPYVGGSFNQTVDFDPTNNGTDHKTSNGQEDGFITKLTSDGGYQWTAIFGGTGYDIVTDVVGDSVGNVYLTGYFGSSIDLDPAGNEHRATNGGSDIFLVKLTSDSGYIWGYAIGGPGNEQALTITGNDIGNVVVGGFFEQSVDFDPTGGSNTINSAGQADGFVTSITASGGYQWTRRFGDTENDLVWSVALENGSNNVYLAGSFAGTVDFDFGAGSDQHTAASNSIDGFITKITAAGTYLWTRAFGSEGDDVAYAVGSASDISLSTYLGGSFTNTVDFDPRASSQDHASFGDDDCFIVRITPDGGW